MNSELKPLPISKEIAKQMVKAYAVEGLKSPKSYTKAVWFSVDQILAMAEKLKESKADGLRIYFAKYTEAASKESTEDYNGRNTVLLVPTNSVDGDHEDDTDQIENRGRLCPDMCGGTAL